MESKNYSQIKEEMTAIQAELQAALADLKQTAWSKLKPEDRQEIEQEFEDIDNLLEKIKSGYIWLAVFGKTTVGKSSVINSIMQAEVAEVNETYDTTKPPEDDQDFEPNVYTREPWKIVDLPGIMGKETFEEYALEEAKKAHGHIFVIAGEPLQDEIESFDNVQAALPETPKIVFVNKSDVLENKPARDREAVRQRISEKMSKYVKSPDDIVFGSARLFDKEVDVDWVRQDLPQLLFRMYEDAGTFGQVVNIIDPANKANDLNEAIRNKVLEVRIKVANRVIKGFATASAAFGAVPFAALITTPGILVSMVYTIGRVMGQGTDKSLSKKMTKELIKNCGKQLGIEFAGVVAVDFFASLASFIPVAGILAIGALGTMGYFRFKQTLILGEVAIVYIKNNYSWGEEGSEVVIRQAKEKAEEYLRIMKKKKEKK